MKNKNLLIGVIVFLAIALIGVIAVSALLLTNNLGQSSAVPPTLDINTAIAKIASSFTATPFAPTQTPLPAVTSTPWPTRTPLPSWTATNTPQPFYTRTPFPSITPTGAAENPDSGLGDPTWIDEFKSDDYWTLFDDDCFTTYVDDGKYVQTTNTVPAGLCWEVTWPKIQDFYLETVATIPGECMDRDRYGIFFRGVDTRRGYMFGITCQQEYWLSYWNSETYERISLLDYTVSDKIKIGPGESNKLGIQTSGERITLYINNAKVAEVYDSTYTERGLVGFFIGAESTPKFTVEYDYLAYWANP